jgi:hypothetical protein
MNSFSPYGSPYPGVRDGRPAPVTCARCGCRLTPDPSAPGHWLHFTATGSRDARGCTVDCVGLAHDRHGIVVHAG